MQAVYKKTPDYTREGGSIPVTLTFAESLGVNVLLLPMGRADDGAQYVIFHGPYLVIDIFPSSTNEKLDRSNFIEGVSGLLVPQTPMITDGPITDKGPGYLLVRGWRCCMKRVTEEVLHVLYLVNLRRVWLPSPSMASQQ